MPVAYRFLIFSGLLCCAVHGQSLRLYSEFTRIDPFGRIVSADRAGTPREILSPAIGRNGFASYRIVVEANPRLPFTLYVLQNPANTVEAHLYREIYERHGEEWIPDRLDPVSLPYTGLIADPQLPIAGQTVQSFWLDLRTPPDAPVGRFRVEVQLTSDDNWAMYPLEVRVQPFIYPAKRGVGGRLAPVTAPADVTAASLLREYICGTTPATRAAPGLTVRHMIRRNALQDQALARYLEPMKRRGVLIQEMLFVAASGDIRITERWCRLSPGSTFSGTEWYLRVRDYLLTGRYSGAASITVRPE